MLYGTPGSPLPRVTQSARRASTTCHWCASARNCAHASFAQSPSPSGPRFCSTRLAPRYATAKSTAASGSAPAIVVLLPSASPAAYTGPNVSHANGESRPAGRSAPSRRRRSRRRLGVQNCCVDERRTCVGGSGEPSTKSPSTSTTLPVAGSSTYTLSYSPSDCVTKKGTPSRSSAATVDVSDGTKKATWSSKYCGAARARSDESGERRVERCARRPSV